MALCQTTPFPRAGAYGAQVFTPWLQAWEAAQQVQLQGLAFWRDMTALALELQAELFERSLSAFDAAPLLEATAAVDAAESALLGETGVSQTRKSPARPRPARPAR